MKRNKLEKGLEIFSYILGGYFCSQPDSYYIAFYL